MKYKITTLIVLAIYSINLNAQVLLDANGPGNTTNDINNVLAPGYDAVEEVCNHTAFGDHIDEIYDNTLNTNVFRFTMHLSPDNNKCVTADRQRNEIKSYAQSPDNLKGIIGETVEYKWKFKLDANFQSSPDFTHIHQLKSVGADPLEEKQPLITLTTRYGASNDKLQLRYAESTSQTTINQVDLTPFKGEWVEVTETVTYGELNAGGAYEIVIKRLSDNLELMNYSNTNMRTWKINADFMRPKWGIYRKNSQASYLRDEQVLFANFSIDENPQTLSISETENTSVSIFPNPVVNKLSIKAPNHNIKNITVYDTRGRIVTEKAYSNTEESYNINLSKLKASVYFVNIETDKTTVIKQIVKY